MEYETFVERYADVRSDPWVGSLGVYIVSPKCPTGFPPGGEQCGSRVPKDVKIGKATGKGGFRTRLKSYYTYWPGGLLVHGLLTTPSMDERYFTYKNHATRRETTLKRVLVEKKLTGFGPSNGTEKILGSEWVHAPPAEVMSILEQIAEAKDKLYGCTEAGCVLVPKTQALNRDTRALRKVVSEKRVVRSKSGEVGDVGVPVVRTRQLSEALRKPTDALHRRAAAIAAAQNETVTAATERLDELIQRKVALAGAPNGPQKERNLLELRNATCRLRGRTIKQYPSPPYTHQDVTGDGRCFFYAVLRAIGLPLSGPSGGGGASNTNAGLEYIDSHARQAWKNKLNGATFGDPIDVLQNAIKMRKAMYDGRGIKYIVKIMKSRSTNEQVAEYLHDPIAFVRAQNQASIWSMRPRAIRYINVLSKAGGPRAEQGAEGQFRTAFEKGEVLTFIWRNIRGQPKHYELILPSRLLPEWTTPTTRRTRTATRAANAKVAKAKQRAARRPAALAEIADTSARARAKAAEAPVTTRTTRRQNAASKREAKARVAREAEARDALSDTALNNSRPARHTRGAGRKKALYAEHRRADNSPPTTTSVERQMKRHQPLHRFHANLMTNRGIRTRRLAYDNDKLRVNGRVVSR